MGGACPKRLAKDREKRGRYIVRYGSNENRKNKAKKLKTYVLKSKKKTKIVNESMQI